MNSRLGFVYSFDMSKEILYFKRMPQDVQISAECNAVDVIYESFVVPGDQDYLMARLLALKGLTRGFFWAAAQEIEKYLKAFLLMNGEGVTKYKGHLIKPLYEHAKNIDSSFAMLDIQPHESIRINPSSSKFLKGFSALDFISELEKHGKPDNRYNSSGVEFNTGHLFALDSLSFKLREKIGVIPIEESFKKSDPDLIQIFIKNNPWFNKNSIPIQIPSEENPIHDSVSATKLEFLIKNKSNPAYGLALHWLSTKMKLRIN